MPRPKVSLPQVAGELVPEPPAAVLAAIRAVAERAAVRPRHVPVREPAAFVAALESVGRGLWLLARALVDEALDEPRAIDRRATLVRASQACAAGHSGAFAALPDDLRLLALAVARRRRVDVESLDDVGALPAQALAELLVATGEHHAVRVPRRQVVAAVSREIAARGVRELRALGLDPSGGEEGDLVALLVAVMPREERTWRRHVEAALRSIDAPAPRAPDRP